MLPITRTRKPDYHLCLLLLVPIILFLANASWLFPYGNPSDSWISDAYFLSYGQDPSLFEVYKLARLPWILKGWLVHHFFEPLTAYYILHFFIFYVCIVAFYYTVKLLFNRQVALIAGIAFATYSQFHSINGFEWDYHTHDATAYALLTLLFLLLATRRPHWRLYLFLAGAACASSFESPFIALHMVSVVFWYAFLNLRSEQKRPWIKSIVLFGLGGVVTTLIYCSINKLAGGQFFYFLTQVPSFGGWPGLLAYEYQASYWKSFPDMLLHSKGIVVTLFVLLLSALSYGLMLSKKADHPNKASIRLCCIAFFLCWPIPVLFQLAGWPALSMDHWLLGMNHFVFLAVPAVVAALLPVQASERNEKLGWPSVVAMGLLCGGLMFASSFQPVLNQLFLNINFIRLLQVVVLLFLLGLLWKERQPQVHTPLLAFLVGITLCEPVIRFFVPSHGLLFYMGFVLMLLAAQLFLLRHAKGMLSRQRFFILSALSFLIFPALFLVYNHQPATVMTNPVVWYPMLESFTTFFFLFLVLASLCFFWKPLRPYGALFSVGLLFLTTNIYTASIPLAFYSPTFKCGYFKDQYVAIMKGAKTLRKFDPTFHMQLWYSNNEVVPYPAATCQRQSLSSVYGMPVINMTSVFGGIWGARYKYTYPPEPGHYGLLKHTLNNLPNAAHWKRFAPAAVKAEPNKPLWYFPNDHFGGYLEASSLSHFKAEKFWLHVYPRTFKLAILSHDKHEAQHAAASLQRYGYRLTGQETIQVKEGVVSYYIIEGIAKRTTT